MGSTKKLVPNMSLKRVIQHHIDTYDGFRADLFDPNAHDDPPSSGTPENNDEPLKYNIVPAYNIAPDFSTANAEYNKFHTKADGIMPTNPGDTDTSGDQWGKLIKQVRVAREPSELSRVIDP